MAAYTNIDDPSAHFQVETYTGNSTSPRTVTLSGNSDMKPDWTWIKTRSGPYYHYLFDSSRTSGSSYYRLVSSETFAEAVDSVSQLTAFTTDGFTLTGSSDMANVNWSTQNYVAWNWKANGGTTASNTDGTITSTVQANTTAGFSIVTATAPGSNGHWSFGHGLGVKPDMVITKQRDGGGWWTWHKDLTNQTTYYLGLNQTGAQTNEANMWGGGMTSSVIGVSSPNSTLVNKNYVAYCFAEKQGYSKFGKYVGNGNANGTFVYTGFKPAMIITKKSSATGNWTIYDNKRDPFNVADTVLLPNANNADQTVINFDFVSNGFKCRNSGSENENGTTYIYMAFAEHPFTTSTGVPATAR